MDKITSEEQLNAFIEKSGSSPVAILKHSTQCPLCAQAFSEAESFEEDHQDVPIGYIVVQEHREISDRLADMTGIKHETPQIFLFLDEEPKWNASHRKVTKDEIEKHFREMQ